MPVDRAMLKIPKYPNLTELAYLHIRQHILDGSLREGERLTEESLASQLGISKSPVREALNRLESEGLISIESRRGAHVRSFSFKEAYDVYSLREVLEVHAVGIAKLTPAFIADLEASTIRTKRNHEDGNTLVQVQEDIRFHSLIAAATGNVELCRILENINQKSIMCRLKTHSLVAVASPNCHDEIYEALKAGDRELARQAMRDHIHFFRDSFLHSLQAEESSAASEADSVLAPSSQAEVIENSLA